MGTISVHDKIQQKHSTRIKRICMVISVQEAEMNAKKKHFLISLPSPLPLPANITHLHQEQTHKGALYVLNSFIFDKLLWSFYGIPKPKYVGRINLNKPCDLKQRIDRTMKQPYAKIMGNNVKTFQPADP